MEEMKKELYELMEYSEDKDRFTLWLEERQKMLQSYSKAYMERTELEIKKAILEIWKKRKGEFFHYEDYFSIEPLKRHFPMITTMGDRNIGKSTSMHRMFRDSVSQGKRFMKLRNKNNEMLLTLNSDLDPEKGYLTLLGLTKGGTKDAPDIYDAEGEKVVGYYRDVNSGKFKSIEFPDVDNIGWDEFNSDNNRNKMANFLQLVTTVQRHRPDLKIITQANYVEQSDP